MASTDGFMARVVAYSAWRRVEGRAMQMLELGGLLGLTVVAERDGRMVVSAAARLRLDPYVRHALKVEDYVKAGRDRSMEVDVEGLKFDFRAWKESQDVRLECDDAWAVVAVGGRDIPVSAWTMRVSSDTGVSVARAEFDLGGEDSPLRTGRHLFL